MKYRFIGEHRDSHSVEKMAEVLGVSRSGYYAWRKRPESARSLQEQALVERIREIQKRVKYRYGSPRMARELAREGIPVGHNRLARLMAKHGLGAKPHKKHRVTTDSKHDLELAENLLARQFEVTRPNQVWVSDITYIPTGEGWLYLAVVIDLYARKVVGWALGTSLAAELVVQAFLMACLTRRPPQGLLFHSDRGVQYASRTFREKLADWGLRQSMSRKGNCWDNAPAEAFFKSLKAELIGDQIYRTRAEARTAIFEYIECFYNRVRLHSSIDYRTPVEYESLTA
jgi:transposase InsO family protein